MAQLLIRKIDDVDMARLKRRALAEQTSVEAIGRKALADAARLTVDEKLALVREMHVWSEAARIPGAPQTLGIDLIREDRDVDH
jgi:plasmid stability protein